MTYFGFLLRFVVVPIAVLVPVLWYLERRRAADAADVGMIPGWVAIALHAVIAVVYTTPWDNYLVATGVWWYREELVTGLTIGWVPIQEYTFFVLQSVFTGLLTLLALRLARPEHTAAERYRPARLWLALALGVLWLAGVVMLAARWPRGTYMGLQLAWALPPLMLQLAFGADILLRRWRSVLATLAFATVYLSVTDVLAIEGGTWTVDPAQSFPVLLGGVLPLEEFTFFLLTNALLVFGITLLRSPESYSRLPASLRTRLPWGEPVEPIPPQAGAHGSRP